METNKNQIAFFIGSSTADNVMVLLDNLSYMLSEDFELHLITTSPDDIDEFIREQFRVFVGGSQPNIQGAIQALWTYHQNNSPSAIIQLTSPPVHGLIVGSVSNRFGIPAIYRYSGDRFQAYNHITGTDKLTAFFINNIVGLATLKLCNEYIVLGPTGKERLVQRGVDQERITILPPSINFDRVNGKRDLPEVDIPPSSSVVLFVGRLHPLKGIKTIKETIPKILSRRNDLHFVFVGENYGFGVPDSYQDQVTVVGRVPPNEVPGYFELADVLIHPSMTEGLPRVVLESLATDTPVIARDVGEISSVTKNTFSTDEEFVEMVCRFEELHLDDVSKFSREILKEKYNLFFENL